MTQASMTMVLSLAVALTWTVETAQARSSGAKRSKVSEIIVHATAGPSCRRGKVVFSDPGTLQKMTRFFKRSGRVSIHYIVGRDGRIAKLIPESRVAIHTRGHNRRSVGIELINEGDGSTAYPRRQVAALVKLVRGIRKRHRIGLAKIKRHSDVDHSTFRCADRKVRRKQDPGPAFAWQAFKDALAKPKNFTGVMLLAPPRLVRRAQGRRERRR